MKYIRKGRTIQPIDKGKFGKASTYPSISVAKREARRIQQLSDGALGRGSVIAR